MEEYELQYLYHDSILSDERPPPNNTGNHQLQNIRITPSLNLWLRISVLYLYSSLKMRSYHVDS